MSKRLNVCLLNDSFFPAFDGVVNTVNNYATVIQKNYGNATVVVPKYTKTDQSFPFNVIKYPSINTTKMFGYRTGIPFGSGVVKELTKYRFDIIHSHCPFSSNVLARMLRKEMKIPLIMTYHTKFDIDVANVIRSKSIQSLVLRAVINNINSCDEVWVVSKSSGEDLKKLGYKGEPVVMRNGVDFPKARVAEKDLKEIRALYKLKRETPTFLFVGRMMWYKGIRIILDGLRIVKERGLSFKMIFVGDGKECDSIKKYAHSVGLGDDCIFTGAVYERNQLREYYSVADMLVLPSVYDNSPIVVLEAAACAVASILIRDSSSAENVVNRRNGLLIEENDNSLASAITEVINDRKLAGILGKHAQEDLYFSWEDAIDVAYNRYNTVISKYRKKNSKNTYTLP